MGVCNAFFLNMFSFKGFLMWTIFKDFIEFVTVLLLFYDLTFWPQGMWDLSFQLRIEPSHPTLEDAVSTNGPPGKSQDYRILE